MMPFDALRMRNPASSSLSGLWQPGDFGDWWRFDAANTDADAESDPITLATGNLNGLLLEDADPANVPNLNTVSGNQAGRFSAPSDRLFLNFGSTIPQPITIIVSLNNGSVGTSSVIVTGSSTTLRCQISVDSSSRLIGFAGTTLLSGTTVPIGAKVLTFVFNGASSKIRINGTQVASGNMGTQGTDQITVGALYDGTNGPTEDIFSLAFHAGRVPSDSELNITERAMGAHQGLSW